MNIDSDIQQEKFQTAGVTMISAAHALHDTYTGFFPALLPVLIERFSMSNTMAGLLSIFMRIPSLLQPIFGHIADRKNLRLLIIITPAITGSAMSLLGIAPSYGFLVFLLIIAGMSAGALHAIGPVMGSALSGKQLGKGMSFWMVGGELGRTLGPLITVTTINYFSIENFPWLLMGGLLISIFLYFKLRDRTTITNNLQVTIPWRKGLRQMRGIMIPVSLLMISRSMITASLTIFLPTFLTNQGSSLWFAGASLTIFQAAGMVGALLAGSLSDRIGRRRVMAISFITTPILMFLFLQVEGIWLIPLLILLGFSSISVVPVIMAVVMENFTDNRSFANGVYMALSFIIGAAAAFGVGLISDLIDMRVTYLISAGFVALGIPVIFWLPTSHKQSIIE